MAGFGAGVDEVAAALPLGARVAVGAGLLAGAVEAAEVASVEAAGDEADSTEADFFERLFLGADEVELFAVAASSADALFLERPLFFDAEAVELSAVAFSSAVDLVDLLFFFEEAAPASADACEGDASAEAGPVFFFFLVFFLVESVWL